MNKKEAMHERIKMHGRHLIALFPNATEQDPANLCKLLRRHEVKTSRAALDYCNGDIDHVEWERIADGARRAANALLGTNRVWVNGDPRGHALKIDLNDGETLHRDWGGNGIIAPDLTGE
jgi:hypothetical protein